MWVKVSSEYDKSNNETTDQQEQKAKVNKQFCLLTYRQAARHVNTRLNIGKEAGFRFMNNSKSWLKTNQRNKEQSQQQQRRRT